MPKSIDPLQLKEVKELRRIQGQPGNWNYSPYMQGLYNGLELAVATLENRPVKYKRIPKKGWLQNRKSGANHHLTKPSCK